MKNINTNPIRQLGYGTGTAWYKTTDSDINRELVDAAKTAVKLGYHHLDGAEVYRTEPELGKAIAESNLPRDQLFVTTKVNQNVADIPAALDASLKKLGLDYVDLYARPRPVPRVILTIGLVFILNSIRRYLIHQPFFAQSKEQLQKAWAAMEQVKAAGKARSIGVSNFLQTHLETVLETAQVIPSVNQIEYHPYLQHGTLVPWQESKGIKTVSYSGLTPATRAVGGPLDSLLAGLATKYAVNPAEILLRWCLDQDVVSITTSSKEARLTSYLRVLTFKLTPAEVKEISEVGQTHHYRAFWQEKFAEDDRS